MAAEQGNSAVLRPPNREKYDQDKTWRQLIMDAEALKGSPPTPMELVGKAVDRVRGAFSGTKEGDSVGTIVHIATDRNIQPQGGVLHRATLLEGRVQDDISKMERMGYAVQDGKVVVVNDIPVGRGYVAINYWGGEKQYRRWHMSKPVTINPSRNGNPFFMDENMIAFGVSWKDPSKMEEALLELCEILAEGVHKERTIGIPLAMELVWQ